VRNLIANADPDLIMAGVFSIRSRSAPRLDLDVIARSRDRGVTRIVGDDLLTVTDESVYLAVVSASRPIRQDTSAQQPYVDLARALRTDPEVCPSKLFVASFSYRRLAKLAGMKGCGSDSIQILERSLDRLAATTITRTVDSFDYSSNLVAWASWNSRVFVTIDPFAARATQATESTSVAVRYVAISVDERGALQGPVARRLHAWLSAWNSSRAGAVTKISLEALAKHVWSDEPHRSTVPRRTAQLEAALLSFNRLPGWIVEVEKGTVHFMRMPAGHAQAA